MLKKLIFKVPVRTEKGNKPLVHAYNEKCFWVHDGPMLSDLKDLLRSFSYMTDVQFAHHVTTEKNDFARWVEDILLDSECAKALRKARTQKKATKVVERYLENYHA